ncbi:MAG: hypothetical protein ACLFQE_08380 [Thermotogota bacterium]
MEQEFTFTRNQLIEAFKKWNSEVEEEPYLFEDIEMEDPHQAAEDQVEYLLKKLNETTRFDDLKKAFVDGLNLGYEEGSNYGEPDDDKLFNEWLKANR